MKILVLADIHGAYQKIDKVLERENKFDLIISPGDITDMYTGPEEFSQLDIADIVIQKLLIPQKPVFCIPGNHDPFDVVNIFEEYGVNIHNKIRTFNGITYLGFGGAQTPFKTLYEPTEEEIGDSLTQLASHLTNPAVIIVHNPPHNTINDKTIQGQHVGSPTIRDFIEKHQPLLCLCAHIYEGRGDDKIGKTVTFYPGPLLEGYYGIVEILGERVKTSIKKIPH
ncbi:MAG: metallophosphoesterase [Nanoarchaeota archaeon]|nr:metallophosphoesterase [Nanoarchaeota archaeon]